MGRAPRTSCPVMVLVRLRLLLLLTDQCLSSAKLTEEIQLL